MGGGLWDVGVWTVLWTVAMMLAGLWVGAIPVILILYPIMHGGTRYWGRRRLAAKKKFF